MRLLKITRDLRPWLQTWCKARWAFPIEISSACANWWKHTPPWSMRAGIGAGAILRPLYKPPHIPGGVRSRPTCYHAEPASMCLPPRCLVNSLLFKLPLRSIPNWIESTDRTDTPCIIVPNPEAPPPQRCSIFSRPTIFPPHPNGRCRFEDLISASTGPSPDHSKFWAG